MRIAARGNVPLFGRRKSLAPCASPSQARPVAPKRPEGAGRPSARTPTPNAPTPGAQDQPTPRRRLSAKSAESAVLPNPPTRRGARPAGIASPEGPQDARLQGWDPAGEGRGKLPVNRFRTARARPGGQGPTCSRGDRQLRCRGGGGAVGRLRQPRALGRKWTPPAPQWSYPARQCSLRFQ